MTVLVYILLFLVVTAASTFIEDKWHREYAYNSYDDNFKSMGLAILYDLGVIARLIIVLKFFIYVGWINA